MYICLTGTTTNEVQWIINRTDVQALNLFNVTIVNGNGTGVLKIPNLTETFNKTTFQCISISDEEMALSEMSQLCIQGKLLAYYVVIVTMHNAPGL